MRPVVVDFTCQQAVTHLATDTLAENCAQHSKKKNYKSQRTFVYYDHKVNICWSYTTALVVCVIFYLLTLSDYTHVNEIPPLWTASLA